MTDWLGPAIWTIPERHLGNSFRASATGPTEWRQGFNVWGSRSPCQTHPSEKSDLGEDGFNKGRHRSTCRARNQDRQCLAGRCDVWYMRYIQASRPRGWTSTSHENTVSITHRKRLKSRSLFSRQDALVPVARSWNHNIPEPFYRLRNLAYGHSIHGKISSSACNCRPGYVTRLSSLLNPMYEPRFPAPSWLSIALTSQRSS